MNERSLFVGALEKENADQRQAYLDETCAGDAVLRERVEALLRSHERQGQFLDVPAVEQIATAGITGSETPSGAPEPDEAPSLAFLVPSDKPNSLGRLEHYEVQEVVGHGGMGIVLKAFDEELHRVAAIKVMAAQLATSATARKRFKREARAAAAVSHDHIVTIHAVEDAGELPYLVMQYVAGASLQQRLDRDGPLDLQEIIRIGMQTASGLAAAHAQGLVHRDIKPANILLENGVERVKITDFGLAMAAADASISQSGIIAGTPQYMAPEQARGEALDGRADLFSLGSVLYAMCTGRAPFRASGTVAVLKRVCEETPTPIRDTNPEIPEWLVAIIDKLHAKDPADRFQSAAEVAGLLGRHLAHIQHPSVVGQVFNLPSVGQATCLQAVSKAGGTPAPRHRRWAVAAAAVLLILLGGLSLTEATGVTKLSATVIRIFTPDGALVVETDDPAVKVTVEGDGGLVITGAGLEEIRLRPGSYRVRADKDGRPIPLDKDLVTVTRGDRAIVKVRLEGPPAVAKAEKRAFVVLGGEGLAERSFDRLAEAVLSAGDGDTIEIRGNGPFETAPIFIQQALTIRAGDGFRPVIRIWPGVPPDDHLINCHAPLVLEGLEIREASKQRSQPAFIGRSVIFSNEDSLHLANCRVLQEQPIHEAFPVIMAHSKVVLRNCEFPTPYIAAFGNDVPLQFLMENCLGSCDTAAYLHYGHASNRASLEFRRNTLVTRLAADMAFSAAPDPPGGIAEEKRVRFDASDNIFAVRTGMLVLMFDEKLRAKVNWRKAEDVEAVLSPLVGWSEKRNLYSPGATSIYWEPTDGEFVPLAPGNLKNWHHRWNLADTGSFEGSIDFRGGELLAKATVTPDDFRLSEDSAGYRAGSDGKDLGADVDLVGPGAAYERWKKTPEYQEWLKDTRHVRAEVSKPEANAFVVLSDSGVAERAFDSLAEAVLAAGDCATIEIRGNGPFVTPPINTSFRHKLTIRAASGYRPVIDFQQPKAGILLHFATDLVLEGLEFRGEAVDANMHTIGIVADHSLHVANCRFVLPNYLCTWSHSETRQCVLKNCEFLKGACALVDHLVSGKQWTIDNCLITTRNVVSWHLLERELDSASIQISRSTHLGHAMVFLRQVPDAQIPAGPEAKPVHIQTFGNVLASNQIVLVHMNDRIRNDTRILDAADLEKLVQRHLQWRGQTNAYCQQSNPPRFVAASPEVFDPPPGPTDLLSWQTFWDSPETNCVVGSADFQGGDLWARLAQAPHKLTPDDFRLSEDSAGYRAGPDGKDLGADVDLVGPGAAYERWKTTPEYQEWLKETGQ